MKERSDLNDPLLLIVIFTEADMPEIGNDPNRDAMAKALQEMTPERRSMLSETFKKMRETDEPVQPMMRQMSFGGDYSFDENRKQVELSGDFSKEDLLRIAAVLE